MKEMKMANAAKVAELLIIGYDTEEMIKGYQSMSWLGQEKPVEVRNWYRSPDVIITGFLDDETSGWSGNGFPRFPTVEFGVEAAGGSVLLCTKEQKERFLRLKPDDLVGIEYAGNRPYTISAADIDAILVVDEAPEEIPESKSSRTKTMPTRTRTLPRPRTVVVANRR